MDNLTRRSAFGLGAVSAATWPGGASRGADDRLDDEASARIKIKDVTITSVDQERRTVDVHFGKPDRPVTVTRLPLTEEIRIRVSHIFPGSVNNVPFDWDRLKKLVGERVSMVVVADHDGIAVDTIATAND